VRRTSDARYDSTRAAGADKSLSIRVVPSALASTKANSQHPAWRRGARVTRSPPVAQAHGRVSLSLSAGLSSNRDSQSKRQENRQTARRHADHGWAPQEW